MVVIELFGRTPKLSKLCFIHELAFVGGSVEIGDLSSVWPYAVLRGDLERIVIGNESNVQDGAILHADQGAPVVIGDGVTIGHRAVVHSAMVGSNTLIGMGAIVMNYVKIGEWCIIGAGAVVTEGTVIPSGSIAMGIPAKVVREVNENDRRVIEQAAKSYVNRTRRLLGLEAK
ncbi:MAG: gamma carbonic anhydrase family protein [Candidatus Bathyarchaeia archaeon]